MAEALLTERQLFDQQIHSPNKNGIVDFERIYCNLDTWQIFNETTQNVVKYNF